MKERDNLMLKQDITGALMPLVTHFGVKTEMTAELAAIVIIYLLKINL